MDKEFYDKYSKDLECSCCQDLEYCINGKEPLKINCAIHYFKDKVADLEAKLAESDEYRELLLEEKVGYLDLISGYADKCKELEQQLATQRNEIYETVIKAMTKHWEDIMSKSGWWLNCGKCKDMEKFFKSVIIDNKIPLTRQETEINSILEQQIKSLKGEK